MISVFAAGATPSEPSARIDDACAATQSVDSVMLRKPGPAISTSEMSCIAAESALSASTMAVATSRGFLPTFFASAIAALTCTSALVCFLFAGRMTGSASRHSSPRAEAIALLR